MFHQISYSHTQQDSIRGEYRQVNFGLEEELI